MSLRAFNRTSVRRGYVLPPILVSILIVSITCLTSVSLVVVVSDGAQYPYVGSHFSALFGFNGFVAGTIAGTLMTLALLYLRMLSNDFFEALTEPWFKGIRLRATLALIAMLLIFFGLPLYIKLSTEADPMSFWHASGTYLGTIVSYFNSTTGGIPTFVVSAVSVIAFYITILQLRDFENRISSFGELMEKLVELLEMADTNDRLHFVCYTPAIGYLAEPRLWEPLRVALLRPGVVQMIIPKSSDLHCWHQAFVGRRTKRRTKGMKVIVQPQVDDANAVSDEIIDCLKRTPGAVTQVDFDVLPGYYCFFTLRRAILVTPLFVPLLADPRMPHDALPPPDMIGFSTSDRGVIDSMLEQFDHILQVHEARERGAAPAAEANDLRKRIEARLDTFRNAMGADGGGVEVAALTPGRLVLRLRGACVICPSQPLTIGTTILPALREVVGPDMDISFEAGQVASPPAPPAGAPLAS